ncbi:MAG: hypothetical protein HY898_17870 [Deltaproteobacteria bacterium]|nr:hypothetical protein [Deltaproteobacteria bacterium]
MLRACAIILGILSALLVIDALLWRLALNRELRRRGLVRVPSNLAMTVDPVPGWRLIEAWVCARVGKLVRVIATARWFRRKLNIDELPVFASLSTFTTVPSPPSRPGRSMG